MKSRGLGDVYKRQIHGLSQLSTVGALRYHSANFYFGLASKVMDILLQGMVNVLELKKPD